MIKFTLFVLLCLSLNVGAKTEECNTGVLQTTLECHASKLKIVEDKLENIVSSISNSHESDSLFIADFNRSQVLWLQSFKSSCDAVYSLWRHGSVKNVKWLQCKVKLTQERLTFLKQSF